MKLLVFASFITAMAISFTSCDSNTGGSGGELTQLDPEDAKVEIRAASQDINNALGTLMEHEGAMATEMFMELSAFDDDWKTSVAESIKNVKSYKVTPYRKIVNENFSLKSIESDPDPSEGGVYIYSFSSGTFLHEANASYLHFIYPADWDAYNSQQLNASLKISDYQYVTIDGEEQPTKFNVSLEVNDDLVMSFEYQASYDSDGMPTSISMSLNMPPYTLSMSQSYSGNTHRSTFAFKEGNHTLMDYNIAATLNDNEDVVSISGHYQVTPLKATGNANVLAIEECMEDISCMNSNINMTLEHTELNAIIGILEFRMVYDPYLEADFPELVVVYTDDTYDVLAEIFDVY